MENYCVYLHIKLDSGEPFYVGKGINRREISHYGRNKWWKNIVEKHGFDIILLEENLSSNKAAQLEKYWISRIGRRDLGVGTLCNLTDGGDGGRPGRVVSDKERQRMIGSNNPFYGKTHTKETRAKIVKANKKRVHTEESKLKRVESIRNGLKDKNWFNSRLILNLETGIYYLSIREAATAHLINEDYLRQQLNGKRTNTTAMMYVDTENTVDKAKPFQTKIIRFKLNKEKLNQILAMKKEGLTQKEIGKHFSINPLIISRILTGKTFTHITKEFL